MDQVLAVLPTVLACSLALTLGGVVKGVISLGLPLVGMPLLLFAVDVPTAVNILMIPLILSNFFQAFEGGNTMAVVRRFALNLVRANKTKGSIKTRRKRAGWSPEFLLQVLRLR